MVFQKVSKQTLHCIFKYNDLDQNEEKCYGTKGKMNLHKEKYVLKEKNEIACRRLEGLFYPKFSVVVFTANHSSYYSSIIGISLIWKKVSRVISFLSNLTVYKSLNFSKPQYAH